jgi:hypothetical protein
VLRSSKQVGKAPAGSGSGSGSRGLQCPRLPTLRRQAVAIPADHPTTATTDQDVLPSRCDEIPLLNAAEPPGLQVAARFGPGHDLEVPV